MFTFSSSIHTIILDLQLISLPQRFLIIALHYYYLIFLHSLCSLICWLHCTTFDLPRKFSFCIWWFLFFHFHFSSIRTGGFAVVQFLFSFTFYFHFFCPPTDTSCQLKVSGLYISIIWMHSLMGAFINIFITTVLVVESLYFQYFVLFLLCVFFKLKQTTVLIGIWSGFISSLRYILPDLMLFQYIWLNRL